MTTLENMAKAIYDLDQEHSWPESKEHYEALARAALNAMRQPKYEILNAGLTIPSQAWEASIDAILEET